MEILNQPTIDVNCKNVNKTTPLHLFCRNTSLSDWDVILDKLIATNADIHAETSEGETPLHRAMENNQPVAPLLVRRLLHYKADLHKTTALKRETPLHYALQLARMNMIFMMINAGAPIDAKNADGQDAIMAARRELEKVHDSKLAADIKLTCNTLENIRKLIDFLKRCGLEDKKELFIKEELCVDLESFTSLTEDQLKNDYGLGYGPIHRMLKEMPNLIEEIAKDKELQREQDSILYDINMKINLLGPYDPIKYKKFVEGTVGDWVRHCANIRFLKRLGKGAFGDVYQATYEGEMVAVKVLSNMDTDDELQEFKSEFQILTQLNSPYVVKFYGATISPYLSMIMEYCENGSLYAYLKRNKYISWKVLLNFCHDIAAGLHYLHTLRQPIVHRDVKSLNILVNSNLNAKLCDFGLSRLYDIRKSTFNKVVGTEVYIAPEIIQDIKTTVKSDIYSLGMVFWEILFTGVTHTHALPFSEYGNQLAPIILVKAMEGLRPSVPHRSPPELAKLYLACVNGKPEERPTAEEIMQMIKEIQESFDQKIWDNYCIEYQNDSEGEGENAQCSFSSEESDDESSNTDCPKSPKKQ
jgi:hypothetical protein